MATVGERKAMARLEKALMAGDRRGTRSWGWRFSPERRLKERRVGLQRKEKAKERQEVMEE